ncbi:MAG: 30S ribosomal protein S7 [Candidatus Shikimatogenerans sp. JK-2022]|nr:30S ribosomal protein S7 [Candidatus Shikimatogenerans bostrichidophilus]
MRKIKKNIKIYLPDIKYKSKIITYMSNLIMRKGKKLLALKILDKALKIIKIKFTKVNIKPLKILKIAIKNASPEMEIKNRKIGGSSYNIPIRLNEKKKMFLAIRSLIINSKKRKNKSMAEKLANEIISTYKGIGETIKKKQEINKVAESNKVFTYY